MKWIVAIALVLYGVIVGSIFYAAWRGIDIQKTFPRVYQFFLPTPEIAPTSSVSAPGLEIPVSSPNETPTQPASTPKPVVQPAPAPSPAPVPKPTSKPREIPPPLPPPLPPPTHEPLPNTGE